jgi:hypothetical protein
LVCRTNQGHLLTPGSVKEIKITKKDRNEL